MKRIGASVLLLLVVAGVWIFLMRPFASADTATDAGTTETASATPGDGIPSRPADAFALTVAYVYDGDTVSAQMVAPNDVVTTANPIRIRLIGVDTPEGTPSPECWADEARGHLADMLPEGTTVWAAPDRDTWDDYRRRLFYLWTDDGRFVNYELVAAGDAEAIRIRPNVAHYDLLAGAQAAARAAAVGRWAAC